MEADMTTLSKQNFMKESAVALGTVALDGLSLPVPAPAAQRLEGTPAHGKAAVYFSRECSAEALKKLYAKVNGPITGKVARKLHTGKPHGQNILPREWVREFMKLVPGSTIVECNVLCASPRPLFKTEPKPNREKVYL